MHEEVITNWEPHHADLFGRHAIQLSHSLNETGLFTEEALAELIDQYPEEFYSLHTMGADPANPVWREGTIGDASGKDVIEAIRRGRLWINLRRIMEVDDRYTKLLEAIYGEFEGRVPGLKTFKQNLTVLISSPNAQVFYHMDVPGQSLWQLQGRKRVYVYPNSKPFLPPERLEKVVMGDTEEEIPYEEWFDDYAEIIDLEPGQMLHWPLNCPHRVVNHDCLNISVTTEHYTDAIRRSYAVNYANGVLRNRLGWTPSSSSIEGPAVYAKAALALAWKKLNLNKAHRYRHILDFKPDPKADNGFVDIPAYQKAM